MVWKLESFPTLEETLEGVKDGLQQNKEEIKYLEYRLHELRNLKAKKELELQSQKDIYKNRKGKTYEEIFDKEKSNEIKQKISDKLKGNRYGPNNPAYKHGKTNFHSSIRRMIEYKKWKCNVLQRDNWTCQSCGVRGEILDVHHIVPFIEIINKNIVETHDQARECDDLWDVNNGVSLCIHCHKIITYGGNY